MKKIGYSIIVVVFLLVFMSSFISSVRAENDKNSVSYSSHVQEIGWQDYKYDGQTSGTEGRSYRLEGIKINLDNSNTYNGEIEYSTHVQEIGWQQFVKNNEMSGTEGRSYRLEAIKIRLKGEIVGYYDIYYRVHAQEFGWLDWACNGQPAGTAGYSYRLEAIEIKLIKKGEKIPANTKTPYMEKEEDSSVEQNIENSVLYSTHVQEIGWQDYKYNGQMSGTSGKGYRLEGIKIDLNNKSMSGDILYRTNIQSLGWLEWQRNGEVSGTEGKSLRLEAIEIKLTGKLAQNYNAYYRVHVQDIGWQEWKKNGEMAGTIQEGRRLEAIEIKLVKKEQGETNILHGIDVSSFNKTINWANVKNDGIQFAMIRLGYRGYGISSDGIDGKLVEDSTFRYNIEEAIKNGIPVGIYFFSQAKNEQEAIDEANFVLERIRNYKITYPVAIDVEYANSGHTGRADSLTVDERTRVVEAFCNKIKVSQYTPMVYTGKNFANNNLNMNKLSQYDLWLAHYTGATQDDPLDKPSNYTGNYKMWQYTSSGSTSGIDGRVDMNISFKEYN